MDAWLRARSRWNVSVQPKEESSAGGDRNFHYLRAPVYPVGRPSFISQSPLVVGRKSWCTRGVRAAQGAMLGATMSVVGLASGCQSVDSPESVDANCPAGRASAPLLVGLEEREQQALLAVASKGLVVARAETTGCDVSLTVLTDCAASGRYTYRAEPDERTVFIKQPKDVGRAMPLAGIDIRGDMALFGGLKLQVLRAGRLVAPRKLALDRRLLTGEGCTQATHVAKTVSLGAYAVAAVEPRRLDDLGDVFKVGPLGGHKTVRKQGRRSACAAAAKSKKRNVDCGIPVRIELQPLVSSRTSVQAVAVRGGRFVRGFGIRDPVAGPAHEVDLDPFLIDATEVAVADYQKCVRAGRCSPAGRGRMCNAGILERASHPINCVAWRQAEAYCRFVGKRLPTEAEWERAALGEHTGPYPWGEQWPPPRGAVNMADRAARRAHPEWGCSVNYLDGFAETAPVGVSGGRSAGIRDLAGNVMEWTADYFAPYERRPQLNPAGPKRGDARVVRGSSFGHSNPADFNVARRRPYSPDVQSAHIGFRCATAAKK